MNINHAHARRKAVPSARTRVRWFSLLLMLVAGLALATPGIAQRTLKDISYQVLPGGKVEISLHFDGPAQVPSAFTTEKPPRIALDFANTANTVPSRSVDIGTGSTSGVSIVTANGRTRVVIDLFRPASYRTHVKGDILMVDVANGKVGTAKVQAYAATDPTKAPLPSNVSVSNIDFRRGDNGAGRVLIDFSGAGANADMHREGDQVIVTLSQVQLPKKFAQHLDVKDFVTPVKFIETSAVPGGARMNIAAGGNVEVSAYQTGTRYVVEISPKAKPKKKAVELGPDGRPKPVYIGQRVTFNFQDIPVRQVLHLIAGESNLNIIVADSVSGQITLRLVNVPWDQALDIVLRAKGLDKRKEGNVVWVAPQAEIAKREQAIAEARQKQEQSAELVSDYIPISYGKAEDIAKLLTQGSLQSTGGTGGGNNANNNRGFLSPRGSVSFDIRTNTLLVNDTPDKVRDIRALVAVLDKPVQQVLIESRIVVATDDFARELGVRFGISGGYEDKHGNVITTSGNIKGTDSMINQALVNRFNNNGSGLPVVTPGGTPGGVATPSLDDRLNINLPVTSPAGSFGLAILGADYLLDLELNAAQTEGKSEVISSPRVITANQQEAKISQGQQIGYQTSTTSGSNTIPTVSFKDATLELHVTPTITSDNRIFLNLSVKKDSLAGYYQAQSGAVPIINHRQIDTSVLVDNGQTVVLGGILEITKNDVVNKVPLLGDIPGLGILFRNKNKTSNRAELLVFVTPRILSQELK